MVISKANSNGNLAWGTKGIFKGNFKGNFERWFQKQIWKVIRLGEPREIGSNLKRLLQKGCSQRPVGTKGGDEPSAAFKAE